jgi:hypothetical protein
LDDGDHGTEISGWSWSGEQVAKELIQHGDGLAAVGDVVPAETVLHPRGWGSWPAVSMPCVACRAGGLAGGVVLDAVDL